MDGQIILKTETLSMEKYVWKPLQLTKMQSMRFNWLKSVWPCRDCTNNMYSADEAGVLYNVTPDKILKLTLEKYVGGNLIT